MEWDKPTKSTQQSPVSQQEWIGLHNIYSSTLYGGDMWYPVDTDCSANRGKQNSNYN